MRRGCGRVIGLSCVNGQQALLARPTIRQLTWACTLNKGLALEVARKGVTVITISPGYQEIKSIPRRVLDSKIDPQILVGGLGKPEKVAALVAYWASEKAAFATGANIAINGGNICSRQLTTASECPND